MRDSRRPGCLSPPESSALIVTAKEFTDCLSVTLDWTVAGAAGPHIPRENDWQRWLDNGAQADAHMILTTASSQPALGAVVVQGQQAG